MYYCIITNCELITNNQPLPTHPCYKKQNRALRGADSVDFNRFGYPSVFNHRVQFRGFFVCVYWTMISTTGAGMFSDFKTFLQKICGCWFSVIWFWKNIAMDWDSGNLVEIGFQFIENLYASSIWISKLEFWNVEFKKPFWTFNLNKKTAAKKLLHIKLRESDFKKLYKK